jgi:hypothetical protein
MIFQIPKFYDDELQSRQNDLLLTVKLVFSPGSINETSKVKVQPIGLRDVEDHTLSTQSVHKWQQSYQPHALAILFLVHDC